MNKNIMTGMFYLNNQQIPLNKTAEYMPITYNETPLGFITQVDGDVAQFVMWTEHMCVIRDEEEQVLRLELYDKPKFEEEEEDE